MCVVVLSTGMVLACSGGGDGNGDGGGEVIASGGSAGSSNGGSGGTQTSGGSSGSASAGSGSGGEGGSAGSGTGGTVGSGASAGAGGSPPSGSVPLFVAQGHAGRTLVSCDDGVTWVADRADLPDTTTRCWSDDALEIDCDHDATAGRGMTYGDGWFFMTFGWGAPGTIRRSNDGVSWEVVYNRDIPFAGIAYGNGTLVAGNRAPVWSSDLGDSWQDGGDTNLQVWNARRIGYAGHGDDGAFIILARDTDGQDVVRSTDGGRTWQHPTTPPGACADHVRGTAYGNGVFVAVDGDGDTCTSTDGGDTWMNGSVGGNVESSDVIFTGSEFLAWGGGQRYSSTDGISWNAQATTPGVNVGAVAWSPETGTYVAVRGGWQVWYDKQRFYRSSDGIDWTEASGPGSHPINYIAFGRGQASSACPAN